MKKENVFCPVPCAEEIVKILEKHKITVRNIDKVLEMTKDIALSNTCVNTTRD